MNPILEVPQLSEALGGVSYMVAYLGVYMCSPRFPVVSNQLAATIQTDQSCQLLLCSGLTFLKPSLQLLLHSKIFKNCALVVK